MADMAKEKVSIGIDKILLIVSAIGAVVVVALLQNSYVIPLVTTVLLLIWGSYYAFLSREKTSDMCCMMSGMAFAMLSGFFVGAVAGLATGDFLIGMIIGAVTGIIFGMVVGRVGGPLARMEGVMAGPMGGIMGAMTGVMVQFYNIQMFMIFLTLIVVFSVWEMTRVIKIETGKITRNFTYLGAILSIAAIASTALVQFGAAVPLQQGNFFQAQQGEFQEVRLDIGPLGYSPSSFTVKEDVPVRLTLVANDRAGCTRDFVFPEFGINKLVPRGGTEVVEFTPTETGSFEFRCSMNMARGTMIVQ